MQLEGLQKFIKRYLTGKKYLQFGISCRKFKVLFLLNDKEIKIADPREQRLIDKSNVHHDQEMGIMVTPVNNIQKLVKEV